MELGSAKTTAVKRLDDHVLRLLPILGVQSPTPVGTGKGRVQSTLPQAAALDGRPLADRDRIDFMGLHVADDTPASQRRKRRLG